MTANARDLNGDVVFSNQLYQRDMALRGYSVKSGLAPTGGGTTTMEVDIAEGVAWVNGVEVPFAGDSIAISAADANYPRKDLISIDSTGTLQVTEGTPGAADPSGDSGAQTFTPVPPALPADETLICEVWVAAAAVGIVDANITDRRLITTTAFGAFDYGMSFEGTVTSVDLPKFLCSNLTGYGDNYFKGYWAYVVWDADGAGAAPQTEKKIITAYVSATGEFTVGAYTVAIGVADKVLIMHPAIMGDVIVEVGEMSDTATADSLSDIATTSVHAKLGRLLLRFSADAFAATVNGSSRADIEAMVTGLASYVKAAGATFAPSIGGSTRADIDAALAALDAEIYTAAHTLKTPNTKIGDIARTIDLLLGSRWDATGDLGTDIGTIITSTGTTIPNLHAVPTADAETNTNMRDAVGNKTDAAVTVVGTTKTLMAYIKGIVAAVITTIPGLHAVPTKDATTDTNMRDAIGKKDDTAVVEVGTQKSILGYVKGAISLLVHGTYGLSALQTLLSAIPTTAMRGTDNAFLASVGGAKNDAAAEGAVTDNDTAMAYIKQLVTAIQLIPTTAMRGTDSAFLASVGGALNDAAAEGAVTNTDTAMAYIKQLVTAIQLIPTTAMRGTDNAALASVLGALNDAAAEGAVTDADTAMAYLKQLVTAIQLIPTTAMRGTDNAFLASVGGALDTAATYAVAADKPVMAYLKGLVDAGIAVSGAVSDVAPSADDFDTTLTEATNNHYNFELMLFTSGVLKGQSHHIEVYTGASKNCNFTAFSGLGWTEAPADGDTFIILPDSCKALINVINNSFLGLNDVSKTEVNAEVDTALNTAIPGSPTADSINERIASMDDRILPGTKFATKTSTSHLTSADLFTFTGSIEIVSILGRVTTALEAATPQTIKLTCTPDALSATDLCATKDANAFAVGSLLTITGTLTDAMIGATGVGCAVSQASMITCTCVTSGKISVVFGTSGSKDGAIVWELLWIPLTPGATCVAA